MLKLPIVEGITPAKELSLIRKVFSDNRLPTDGVIVPCTPSPPRLIPLTNSPEHVTPVHEQIEESGLPSVQDHPDTAIKVLVFVAAAKSHIAASSVERTGFKRAINKMMTFTFIPEERVTYSEI